MKQLSLAVLFLVIIACTASDLNDVYENTERDELDQYEGFDQPENFVEEEEDFEPLENSDEPEYQDYQALDDTENDESEIEVIAGHLKYQDAARAALLQLAAKLRKGKNVTNAFLKVIDGFEKRIAEFQSAFGRRRPRPSDIRLVQEYIREAAKNGRVNTQILRELTAQGIFFSEKSPERKHAVAKRSDDDLLRGARAFLYAIKDDIGEAEFDEYLSVNGLTTLMFTIDTTGSMSGDIRAAIAISVLIVTETRENDVDYILSPFNDPSTGPVTIKNETEGDDFVTALRALRATGGGDCPELAFKGMINALESGPQPGSSMYVFTDASAKDATEDNKDTILDLAHSLDVKINFFTRGDTGCGRGGGGFEPYENLASETGGLVYPLRSSRELTKVGKLIATSLRGSTSIGSGSSGGSTSGRRRRAAETQYPISVDDSVESLTISVTTQNSGASISLVDPSGNTVTLGRVLLLKGVVYNIAKPVTGVYRLIVPASVGKHKYQVNAVSGLNIDFGHYYVFVAKRGRRIPVPLEQPLQGFLAKAFVTVAGAEYVKADSLGIKVVDASGSIRANQSLIPVGTSGVRYFVRFNPPSGPFKLQLHGQTMRGEAFVRVSSRADQATPVLIKLAYKNNNNILHRGQRKRIAVVIRRGNVGARKESYKLTLKDKRGYGMVIRQPRPVRRGRQGFARIEFNVPSDAPVGESVGVTLLLDKDEEAAPISSLSVAFLITDRSH